MKRMVVGVALLAASFLVVPLRAQEAQKKKPGPAPSPSEAVLEHFGVTEANWKEGAKKEPPGRKKRVVHDARQDFLVSESPRYIGRAVVALASDANVMAKSGRVLTVGQLAVEYGFTDVDGRQWPPFQIEA